MLLVAAFSLIAIRPIEANGWHAKGRFGGSGITCFYIKTEQSGRVECLVWGIRLILEGLNEASGFCLLELS